jgi:hypothetical protein
VEKLATAIGAIGGLAAIGALVDYAIARDKAKVDLWMLKWWAALDDVKWGNFSRREALLVVAWLDRYFGYSFLSSRRWRTSFTAVLAANALAYLWVIGRYYAILRQPNNPIDFAIFFRDFPFRQIADVAIDTVFFAVSLSLTRFLSVVAARCAVNLLATLTAFLGLLAAHIALFMVWSVYIVPIFGDVFSATVADLANDPSEWWGQLEYAPMHLYIHLNDAYLGFVMEFDKPFKDLAFRFSRLMFARDDQTATLLVSEIVDLILGTLANGLRVAFALLFVVSIAFKSVLQPLTSRIWEGILMSGRPIFTVLFSIVGGLIAGLRAAI